MDLLQRLKETALEAGSNRLPSIRELARRWNVAPGTVQLVVKRAREAGWLETRPGAGLWTRGHHPTPAPSTSRPTRRLDAIALSERLATEIASGRWAGDERLPSPKDLAQQHGVHPSTARKALALLAQKGLATRVGRTWTVTRPKPRRAQFPILLCLGAADPEGGLRVGSDREWEFWREIQAEATRCGLRAVVRPWDGDLGSGERKSFGAIVSTWHLPSPHELLSVLQRARLPSAVWLENPVLVAPSHRGRSSPLWFHDMAYGREAGLALGTNLAFLDHKKVAWIGPFHQAEWSRNRLEGLRAGFPPGTTFHEAVGPWVSEWDIQNDVWSDPAVWARLHLDGIGHQGRTADLVRPVMEAVGRDRLMEAFSPSLEAALAWGATLWVCASDMVALWCLAWLEARGVRVPRDLSLAGFDDSREALRHDLTSVRFDAQAMARAMVRQILSPSRAGAGVTRYQGTVVVRGSTPGRT